MKSYNSPNTYTLHELIMKSYTSPTRSKSFSSFTRTIRSFPQPHLQSARISSGNRTIRPHVHSSRINPEIIQFVHPFILHESIVKSYNSSTRGAVPWSRNFKVRRYTTDRSAVRWILINVIYIVCFVYTPRLPHRTHSQLSRHVYQNSRVGRHRRCPLICSTRAATHQRIECLQGLKRQTERISGTGGVSAF